ncbi:DegT/DnrJ/EryC1/StrS family aminotransferase [Vicingus serpentipes]|uniref:DegT/DnrJ/EryC1/StrS family aminotransferase n=1 Tax=Vicingus serpentipes TaxID=1926625 RepID=A0A5C6RYH4_9FLAO|nr:DegT/DnrJ/EryC1/StrS family aminotransferase [Vicingus serpentipes]TXB66849.1 DegT/DnrJ/EryC1/StrS family aminotransferase [Vicingus serpentipes]
MKDIQMVDLKGQYQKIKSEVDKAIINVVETSAFINGPEVKAFQEELEAYLGVKHVIPCANGTDALQIALMALGLEPGDEVITSDFTFAATVEVIGLLQLTPVLIDVDPNTFCVDIEKLKKVITPKTKAIVPVHLFGQCANMEAIMEVANKHNIYVVEDNAQAIGAEYTFENGVTKKAGTIGNIGTTSFFPSKNLGCYGDGGALFTNDDNLAELCRSIVNHGMGERYYYPRLGVNSRLDSIQAAILRIKLRELDSYNQARNKAAAYYDDAFAGNEHIKTPFRDPKSSHAFHQYTLVGCGIDHFELQKYLGEKGVPCMIYYPVPLHTQDAYKTPSMKHEDFEVTNALCGSVFSLPMHTELTEEQLKYITDSVKEFVNKK